MSAVARPLPVQAEPVREWAGSIVLDDVSWETYERLRADTDESNVRITYDQGRMALMSPLPIHERVKTMLGRFIEVTAEELAIPCACLGSTTWKWQGIEKGFESDECYFIQHEAQVRGQERSDFDRGDPPPDLAVEVDIAHHPMDRLRIYAAFGVPELWRYDGTQVEFLRLAPGGRYEPMPRSAALPAVTADLVNEHVRLLRAADETTIIRAFRARLRAAGGR